LRKRLRVGLDSDERKVLQTLRASEARCAKQHPLLNPADRSRSQLIQHPWCGVHFGVQLDDDGDALAPCRSRAKAAGNAIGRLSEKRYGRKEERSRERQGL